MASPVILHPDANGTFSLQKVAKVDVARIDIADVDLVLTLKDGSRYILPNGGIAAMGGEPANITFSDATLSLGALLSEVGVITDIQVIDSSPSTLEEVKSKEEEEKEKEREKELEKLQQEVAELKKEIEAQEAEAKKEAEEFEKFKQEHAKDTDSPVTQNTETAVEKMVEEVKKITENLHTSDKQFSEPVTFKPPPAPFSATPGLPAPISLTPIASISTGNVVGTTVAGSNIYGGGGAVGSESSAYIGARDPLQFSAATITGTNGNDVIYSNGPQVGNPNPAVDRSNNAKEFLLNVAGYFTSLNDVIVSGVPASVSFVGAVDNGDGTWTIPSSSITDGTPVVMIYNMDAWRGGPNTFDLEFNISGSSVRGATFETIQAFRFLYMDVTDVSQVTDPTLIWEDRGQVKQIYVLPTLGQPNIINSGEGDDVIYGGANRDTVTSGDGNNQMELGAGHDIVTTGNGNNQINVGDGNDAVTAGNGDNTVTLGAGNNTLTTGSGLDIVTAGDGTNLINVGDGNNNVTLGNGNNTVTSGAGIDTISAGDGTNIVNAGDGANTITLGDGNNTVTSGTGADIISLGDGANIVAAGDGNNNITFGIGNNTVTAGAGVDIVSGGDGDNTVSVGDGNNSVTLGNGNNTITSGAGDDTFIVGNGNNVFRGGLGINSFTSGTGNNTVDYSVITTTSVIINLNAGTSTGTGLSDTYAGVQNAVGGALGDTITGTALANVIYGGDGNDTITGNGGNDTLYGEGGNDIITGGIGSDTIYAGDGNNTVYTGASGFDRVYGGTGNTTFISQHAGVVYNGTNGGALQVGQYNTVDYTASGAAITVNLTNGFGSGGLAQGDTYAFTSVAGQNSINRILGTGFADSLTGSSANDYLDGAAGDDSLSGGAGNDTLLGGLGTNNYTGGGGADTFTVNTAAYDRLYYSSSGAGAVLNFDGVVRSFVNTLGVTVNVAAYSGSNKAVTAADASSDSNGDIFTTVAGVIQFEEVYGSAYGDVIFGNANSLGVYSGIGQDFFYGGNGNELFSYSYGNDRLNAGGGTDVFWAGGPNGGNYFVSSVIHLDGTLDSNGNGVADSIDRGVTLTAGGVTYTGFARGLGSDTSLLLNFENLLGEQGNDYLVGNNNANTMYGRVGTNTLLGMGGNDTIHAAFGANTIDGGAGTDVVDFSNTWYTYGTTTSAYVFLSDANFFGLSDKAIYSVGSGFQSRIGAGSQSTIINVENITGSSLVDVLYGNSSNNVIRAGASDDIIAGNGGADSLYGEAGNDAFYSTSAQVTTTTLFDGGANTDSLYVAGMALTAGSISNARFVSIEDLNIRNNASGGNYSINANDITGMADLGISSRLSVHIDTGDTLSITTGAGSGALSYLVASSTPTLTTYYLYSDAAHVTLDAVNRVAILDVYTGV